MRKDKYDSLYPGSELDFFTLDDNVEFIFEETPEENISKFIVMGQYVFEKI